MCRKAWGFKSPLPQNFKNGNNGFRIAPVSVFCGSDSVGRVPAFQSGWLSPRPEFSDLATKLGWKSRDPSKGLNGRVLPASISDLDYTGGKPKRRVNNKHKNKWQRWDSNLRLEMRQSLNPAPPIGYIVLLIFILTL